MACAACLAAAAVTLPAVEKAGSDLAKTADVNVQLAVDLSQLAAFDAIPAYIALLTGTPAEMADALNSLDLINGIPALQALGMGNLDLLFGDDTNAGYDALSALDIFFGDGANGDGGVFSDGNFDGLSNYDALSALPVFFGTNGVFTGGGIDALAGYDALSAIPPYIKLAGGDITATGDLASLSAVDTFFGDGPIGADGVTPIGGVFTGGGIDALAPGPDGNGGYAALSALPVFFGPDTSGNAPFGKGVFAGGGIGALTNYAALSAIPVYLNTPQTLAVVNPAQQQAGPQARIAQDPGPTTPTTGSDPTTGTDPVKTFSLPKLQALAPPPPEALTPPAPPKVDPAANPGDNSGPQLNVSRASEKFEPTKLDGTPFLFGSGTPGADNGIRGWGDMLKKAGIGGGDASSGG
jgi:hypothetical protein